MPDFKLATSFLEYPHFSKVETLINNPIIKDKFPKETNISIQDLKQSISSLYVYYEDRKYTVIRKEPKMTLLDLISNIGGIMGIFIGASFLSFVELFELLLLKYEAYESCLDVNGDFVVIIYYIHIKF